jgi:RHS repeat-associated protein
MYGTDGYVDAMFNGTAPASAGGLYIVSAGNETGDQICVESGTSCIAGSTAQPVPTGPGAVRYYLADHLGTTTMELSSGGWPLYSGDFAPYGQEIIDGAVSSAPTDTSSNHYKFTGKERDAESGLDYFGARYYTSSMGRWMSPDWSAKEEPVPYSKLDNPQSLNLYSYVYNNPLSKADPDGHCPVCIEEAEEVLEEASPYIEEGAGKAEQWGEEGAATVERGASSGWSWAKGVLGIGVASAAKGDNKPSQSPTPGSPVTPKPQDSNAPSPSGEHDKGARPSTKDKHEKVRPGTSPPPNYKPDRKFKQPRDDKKKDQKEPYVRKDRDKPAS